MSDCVFYADIRNVHETIAASNVTVVELSVFGRISRISRQVGGYRSLEESQAPVEAS